MMNYKLYKKSWIWAGEPHLEQKLSRKECDDLLSQGGIMVRNVYDFDTEEQTSFWHVIKDSFGGMEELSKSTRNRIRKANEKFEIKRISKEQLSKEGYHVYETAFEHYKVKADKQTPAEFAERLIENQSQAENYDYWGCIDRETGNLEAYAICRRDGEMCDRESSKANPAFLPKYFPLYGLYYALNEYYLGELKLKYVDNGTRSITNHSNIQPFLMEKFNFRQAYCRLQVVYKWWLKPVVKLLYPFRNIIPNHHVRALLSMEEMQKKATR